MASSIVDGFSIRHALAEDIEAYRELRLEALKNHPTTFGQDYEDVAALDNKYWENTLKIDTKEKALFFAENNSQLIGMTGVYRNLSKKSDHAATVWGVYVRPEWRGKRISQTLVCECLRWAKEQQITIVKLAVVTDNPPAIRCYERCGFTIHGREPKAILYDGVYYDEYLMSIEIGH